MSSKKNDTKSSHTSQTLNPVKENFFSKVSQSPLSTGKDSYFFSKGTSSIQTKLTVGAPDDAYEKEADAMANNVVQQLSSQERMTKKDRGVQAKPIGHAITPIVQSKCDTCEKEEKLQREEEVHEENSDLQRKPIFESNAEPPPDDESIQRKCAHCEKEEKLQKKEESSSSPASAALESSLMASKGSGASLAMPIRQEMESSFGTDFSNVRLHTGSNAEAMNKGLHAQAFTHGNDIYFNSGKFDTNSNSGKQLLAHELTHTIQQNGPTIHQAPNLQKQEQDAGKEKIKSETEKLSLTLDDGDMQLLQKNYPDGIQITQDKLLVVMRGPTYNSAIRYPGFIVNKVSAPASTIDTFIFQVGKGRSILVSSQAGGSILLDAGAGQAGTSGSTSATKLASALNNVILSGLAQAPREIKISHIDIDHYNALDDLLKLPALSKTTVLVSRQQMEEATKKAGRSWNRMNVQFLPTQSLVQIDVVADEIRETRAIIGDMEIIEYRSVAAHKELSGARYNKNNTSAVTVVRDTVSNTTQVFTADSQGRLLSEVVDIVGEDAFRRIIGGGSANLSLVEVPHHGGAVDAGPDARGMVRFYKLAFEASDGKINFFAQTSDKFSDKPSSTLKYLRSSAILVDKVTDDPSTTTGTSEVRKVTGKVQQQVTISSGVIQQIKTLTAQGGDDIRKAYETLYNVNSLLDQMNALEQGFELTGEKKLPTSMKSAVSSLDQSKKEATTSLENFWKALETSAGKEGMRTDSDVKTIQTEVKNVKTAIEKISIEKESNTLNAIISDLNLQGRLMRNVVEISEAIVKGDLSRLNTAKSEQTQLLRLARASVGAKLYSEILWSTWKEVKEDWVNRLTETSRVVSRIEAIRAIRADQRSVLGESLARQVQLNELAESAMQGAVPGGGPAPVGSRVGAGIMLLFELIRMGLELAVIVKESNESKERYEKLQKIQGFHELEWWQRRGVIPVISLVKKEGWWAPKYVEKKTGDDAEIYKMVRGEGTPIDFDRVVIKSIRENDLMALIRRFYLEFNTMKEWIEEFGNPNTSDEWFSKKEGKWAIKLWNGTEGQYFFYTLDLLQKPLNDLYQHLEEGQKDKLKEQQEKYGTASINPSGLRKYIKGKVAYVYNSSGNIIEVSLKDFTPSVSDMGEHFVQGDKVHLVKAADIQTYNLFSGYYWKREGDRYAGGDCISCISYIVEPNAQGFAYVDPSDLKSTASPTVQPKLELGNLNDPLEEQADAMADKVVQRKSNMDLSPISTNAYNYLRFSPYVQRMCTSCALEKKLQPKLSREHPDCETKNESVQQCSECNGIKLQRMASGSPDENDSLEQNLNSSKGKGSLLPANTRKNMEASFGADFSNVRVHDDNTAAEMSKQLSAHAFTYGSDIYFNSDKYNPNSREGKHLLAHELTHTIQQNTNQKVFRATDEDLENTSAEAEISGNKIGYEDYVKKYASNIALKLGYQLSLNSYEISVPHVTWINGSSKTFTVDLWSPIWDKKNDLINVLSEVIAPDPLQIPINSGRDAIAGEGTDEWREGVITELDRYVSRRLIMGLRRILPLYVYIMNQKQTKNELEKLSGNIEPTTSEIVPAHPFDNYIIPALKNKLSIDFREYRKTIATDTQKQVKELILRPVEVEFMVKNLAPNWIKVNPSDATKEETAKELYGTETKAWALTGAAPYYALPHRGPGRKEMYLLKPKYEQIYSQIEKQQEDINAKDPVSNYPDYLATGLITNDVALSQAKTIQKTGAGRPEILQRINLIVKLLVNIISVFNIDYRLKPKLPWLYRELGQIQDRYQRLTLATDQEVSLWDGQTLGQLQLMTAAYEGITMAETQLIAFKGFDTASLYVEQLGFNYVDVVRYSDFYITGSEALQWANDQSKIFPVVVLDKLLTDVRKGIESAKEDKTKALDPKAREKVYDIESLNKKEHSIRQKLVQARAILLQDPTKLGNLLKEISNEIQNLEVGATLVTDMDAVDRAWRELYDAISFSGEIRAIWGGGNAILSDALDANRKLWLDWTAIYKEWKEGNVDKAKKDLNDKVNSDEWKGYFKKIGNIIDDHKTIDKWMNLGLMIGITILSGGLGAYVDVYLGTAWGVANLTGTAALTSWRVWAVTGISIATEAATFTLLSTAVLEKDPSVKGFMQSFGENLLLFGGLRAISKTYGAIVGLEKATSVSGKIQNLALQFTAVNGLALYKANVEKNKRVGKSLTWDEIMDISFHNLAFMVAVAIAGKLTEKPLQRIIIQGKLQAGYNSVDTAQQRLLDIAKQVEATKGENESINNEFKKRAEELLKAQENLWTDLAKIAMNPSLAKAAGISAETLKDIHSSLSSLQEVLIFEHLEPFATNEFLCSSRYFDQVRDFYSSKPDTKVSETPRDPVTNVRTLSIQGPERNFRITERISESKSEIVSEPKDVSDTIERNVTPKVSFEERLKEILTLNTEKAEPPYLKHCIEKLKGKISDDAILSIIKNGFLNNDVAPTDFFSDLNSLLTSQATKSTLSIILDGLAGDQFFYTSRFLMERASWNQSAKVNNILSKFTLADFEYFRLNYKSGSDSEFTTNIDLIARSINDTPLNIRILLTKSGNGPAALNNLCDAINRLGEGTFDTSKIMDSLNFGQKLQSAVQNNAQVEQLIKIIFGDAYSGKEGEQFKVAESLTKKKSGDLAASFIGKRKSAIASIIIGGDNGTSIDLLNWELFKDIINKTDLPTTAKNSIIGELWAYSKVRTYENLGYKVTREVRIYLLNPDGTLSKTYTVLDAVLQKGNEILYKEFKSSDTATTTKKQTKIYKMIEDGKIDQLKPSGDQAVDAFGKNSSKFKSQKVQFELP